MSGDGVHFGVSPFAPGVLAFSRILNDREVIVVANASTVQRFRGHVLIDAFLHRESDVLSILNVDGATLGVETRAGLEIQEIDGGMTSGPARMIPVDVPPMGVLIVGRP